MKKSTISNEALNVLLACRIESFEKGTLVFLPTGEKLEKNLYLEVNKVLETFGGKWNRKNAAHLFKDDPTDKINDAVLTGDYTRLDKNGYFPTPQKLADEMAALFSKDYYKRVLEPSFGSGNLIRAFAKTKSFIKLIGCESNKDLFSKQVEAFIDDALNSHLLLYNTTFEQHYEDFIHATHATRFDAVIMNPPFERAQDAKHIRMAIDLLAPQGELVSICSAGLLFRQDAAYRKLREFLTANGATITQLPEKTFKESGTNINTVLIYYKNNEEYSEMKNEKDSIALDETAASETTATAKAKGGKKNPKVSKSKAAPDADTVSTDTTPISETNVNGENVETDKADSNSDASDAVRTDDATTDDAAVPIVKEYGKFETGSDFVYSVNKESGVIGETTRKEIYTAMKEKLSESAIDTTLNAGKVVANAPDYYALDSKKLKKFEKAQADTPKPEDAKPSEADKRETDTQAPATPETPSNATEMDNTGASAKKTEAESSTDAAQSLTGDAENADDMMNGAVDAKAEAALSGQSYEGLENAPFEQGDRVVHTDKPERTGIVVFADNVLKVNFEINGKPTSSKDLTKWRRMTEAEIDAAKQSTALAKTDDVVVGEIVLPMTDEEKATEQKLRGEILTAKETYERAENIMAENISLIRDNDLWRESLNKQGEKCKSFKEYIVDVLGFNDKYGQNLAQIGGFRHETAGLLGGAFDDASINAQNAMIRGTNKIIEALGVGDAEYGEVRPIVEAAFEVLGEVIKDENGNIDKSLLKPQVITKTAEKIVEVVKTETVEIDGKQMTVTEAREKGIIKNAFTDSVMNEVAEGIKTNKQFIRENLTKDKEEREKPVLTNNNPSTSGDEYTGRLPNLAGSTCAKHGKTDIISIGNGVLQTSCLCRWRIDAHTKKLTVYEVEGKKVKGK